MSNLQTLRQHLFDTLAGLKADTIKIDQARAINETAQVIINSAKVEVDFMRYSGKVVASEFMQLEAPDKDNGEKKTDTANGQKTVALVPGGSVTTHRMR